MDLHTERLTERYLLQHTHDGVRLALPRRPPSPLALLFATVGWLVVGALSLVLVAQPVAAFVEAMGWWLVNERILQWRWMWIGSLIWPFLAIPVAAVLRGPRRLRLQLDQNGVSWRHHLFGWQRVAWTALRSIRIRGERIGLTNTRGRTVWMPSIHSLRTLSINLDQYDPLRDVVRAIDAQRTLRTYGSVADIPAEIRTLVKDSPQPVSSPPA